MGHDDHNYISTIQNQLQSFPQFLPLDNFLNRLNPRLVVPSIILLPGKSQSTGPPLPDNDGPRFGASIPAELQPDLANTLVKQSSQSIIFPSRCYTYASYSDSLYTSAILRP